MTLSGSTDIRRALQLVGELLAADGLRHDIVILGGAALNLLGLVERATIDVDILAFAAPAGVGAAGAPPLQPPTEPLPASLVAAARTVARDLGLDPHWLNTGPALQWRAGLPVGLATRVHWYRFSGLHVGLVDRYDLIFFKLFAAADAAGPSSVHYQDLLALRPNAAELQAAGEWVATQDASPAFATVLDTVLRHVRDDLAD